MPLRFLPMALAALLLAAGHGPARAAEARPAFPPSAATASSASSSAATAGAAASATAPTAAASAAGRPLRIVAIGDSITQGGRAGTREYTYRWPLARMLRDADTCVAFVGSHRGGMDAQARWPGPWDSDNEGYYGATTAAVRDHLAGTLPTFAPPDLALVHLGTNDAQSRLGSDTIDPLRAIVGLLRAANPKVVVLLAEPRLGRARATFVLPRIRLLARELSTAASPVETVDHHTGWESDPREPDADTFDGVHPNLRGQRRMAETWLLAMRPWLPPASTSGCPGG